VNHFESLLNHFESQISKKSFKCEFCKKVFSTSSNKSRHQKTCKDKTTSDDQTSLLQFMSQQIKEMKEEKEELKAEMNAELEKMQEKHSNEIAKMKKQYSKEIETLLEKVGSTVNNTYIKEQNIIINNYGKENLDYISTNHLTQLLRLPYGAIPKLIKRIHFHPQHPENHNVKITNKKLPYASIWKDDKWVVKDKNEVIDDMVDKSYNMIDEHYDENMELDSKKKKNWIEFQHKYDSNNKNLRKTLHKDTEIVILNRNNYTKQTSNPISK